ncbi:MAG: acyl-CoA dehydrogenase family protein [Solirubrobacteraceae bacterium]|nr:acyl-CoA dehydrogenase family protein [Patulibacter sp.]
MSELATIAPYLLPDEMVELRDLVRSIAKERVAPRAAELDAKSEYGWDIRQLLSENDIFGLPFDVEHGGTGTGTLMLNIAIEELAKADGSTALMLMTQELGTLPIKLFGSDEIKNRVLPDCASGKAIPAFGLSEPGAGSDPGGMITTARQDGDDWIINGTKNWISNAGIATFYVVFAVTDRENRRITAFLVESDREGVSVGKLEHKMGMRSSPTGMPIFDDVRVPAANVIGEVGKGLHVALGTLQVSRLGAAAQAVGLAQGATDHAVAYAKEREQFGKSLSKFQGMQWKLADMEAKTAAARELLYAACCKIEAGTPDASRYSSMAKLICADTAMAVTTEAVQVFGGYGYVTEYPVERYMRDAKLTQIYEGTSEIQRVVISRDLLG